MESHLMKLKLCFRKCKEYRISQPKIMCFMVFSGLILRLIISKEGKIPDLKKVHAIVNMLVPMNPLQIQVFNGMAQFYRCFINNFAFIMAPITKLMKKIKFLCLNYKMSRNLGSNQAKIYGSTNFDTSKLVAGFPCAHKCIFIGNKCNVNTKPNC